MLCEQHVPVRTSVSDRSKDVSVTTTRKPQPGTNILGRYHLHKICKCRMGVVIHCTYGEFGVAVVKKEFKKCIPL